MTPELSTALERLSPTQRQAVQWADGAALVLAGPGVGKTTVLTARIARILEETPNQNFRILALTFTTKAGDEMRGRVESLVPGFADRTVIGTFHSFCAQMLRQHGSHLGISPDFGIYDQEQDREELLHDALAQAAGRGESVSAEDTRWLKAIDQLRSSLVGPVKAAKRFKDPKVGERVSAVYTIYENALRERNVMDFNGMILDTCRLAHSMPAIARRIQQSYPYWMIDEFQDTTPAQYKLIKFLAGNEFKNVFAVADDDQIIYQWAGASYQQIANFREEFSPELMQLVENRRCPPAIVQAANNLVAHNADRTPGKIPLIATLPNAGPAITLHKFQTDTEEATSIAKIIFALGDSVWGRTAILGRTRAVLEPVLSALRDAGVVASIATRRDRFVSPQFNWLQSCLDQSLRPANKQIFTAMVSAANRISGTELDAAILAAEAESSGSSYLEYWALASKNCDNEIAAQLGEYANRLVQSRATWPKVLSEALIWLPKTAAAPSGTVSDADEDKAAWDVVTKAIRAEKGSQPDLDELLQGIALRPKEPPNDPRAVRLSTIHAAKGLEFDYVWVVGLAESVLPSWQSLKANAKPAELEEERRNCFVAITRTKMQLNLSYATQYRGSTRMPSRFLSEMKLDQDASA